MANYWKYIRRGLAIVSIITTELPGALMDGKLTIEEMASLLQSICQVANWDVEIDIPEEVRGVIVAIHEMEDKPPIA